MYISTDNEKTYKQVTSTKDELLFSNITAVLISKDDNILKFDNGMVYEVEGDLSELVVGEKYQIIPP